MRYTYYTVLSEFMSLAIYMYVFVHVHMMVELKGGDGICLMKINVGILV